MRIVSMLVNNAKGVNTGRPTVRDPMLEIHAMPGHLFRRMHQISVALFAERTAAAGFDVTPVQFGALSAIAAAPDIDQATLAGVIAYDRVTIGGVVERLEHKGYVRRTLSSRDRRARQLRLTRAGRTALDRLAPIVRSLQAEIVAGLAPEEQRTLLALLAKAAAAGNESSRAPLRLP